MRAAGTRSADPAGRPGGAGQRGGRARQPPEGGRRRLDPAAAGALGPPRAPLRPKIHEYPASMAPDSLLCLERRPANLLWRQLPGVCVGA